MRPLFFALLMTHGLLAAAAAPDDLPPPPPPPEPAPSTTKQPLFGSGGGIFGLQYGPGFWGLDEAGLESQLPAGYGHLFVSDANTDKSWQHTAGIRIGYNILGHASVEINIVGTGWNIFNNKRGGAGFATGVVAWHPLQLVFMNKPERPIPLDVSMAFGVGYGIAGQTFGMDGLVLQWGLNAEWYFTKFIALGLFVKGTFLQWHTFYLDFDNKVTLPLPKGSGGAFWFPGIEVLFRFGE